MKCSRGATALYAIFSLLLISSLFLLFTTYAAGTGALTTKAQEQFHLSLLAGRISNLALISEQHNIASETVLPAHFFLYGLKPANYTLEQTTLKSGSSEARIKTNGAKISMEDAGSRKILRAEPE